MWNEFLKLVPKESLTQPASGPHTDAAKLEQLTSARFEAAFQQYSARFAQLAQATARQPWQPPAPVQQYLAGADNMHKWLIYCASFDAVAEQLRAAGRPAFAARLNFVKDDTGKALAICYEMAKAAGASQQHLADTAAAAVRDATETVLRMNRDTQKAYDAANEKWQGR